MIDWPDALKLTMPLFTAVLMVWIKGWIETEVARRRKRHVLSRLLHDELMDLARVIEALKRIARSASEGKLRLLSINVSALVARAAGELADLDPKRSYAYADLSQALEVVDKGFQRLAALTLTRAGSPAGDARTQLDRAIAGQARITASDYMTMAGAALQALRTVPGRDRYNNDAQSLAAMEQAIAAAERARADWPETPPPLPAAGAAPDRA